MGNSEAERLRDVVRAKDPMRSLCQERLITPEACDWVKSALDPFHDQQLENLRGYPDIATEPTVVVKVRQAINVSAPSGLPDGHTWDCHMILSPIDFAPKSATVGVRAQPMGGGTGATNAYNAAGLVTGAKLNGSFEASKTGRMDGLVINSVPGDTLFGGNSTFTPAHMPPHSEDSSALYQSQNITLDDYLDFEDTDLGVYRIVYSGFEVVNTTAQIYKQGAVTVYEYGNSYEIGASSPDNWQDTNLPVGFYNPTTYLRCPPNNLAEAKIMPGSHSWAAQDGSYNTAKFQTENPFQSLTSRPWVISQNKDVTEAGVGYMTPSPLGRTGVPYSAGSFASSHLLAQNGLFAETGTPTGACGPVHFSRMNTTGAYYTGLSKATTLFVTWRVGIERLPSANKPAFLALAQPSASFDPNALVLYNMVANVLPPGCPQGYNDAGKWYNWIASAAKNSIPHVYPIVRMASTMAAAMGRPLLATGLKTLEAQMKPVAQKAAATRLQAAVRGAKGRKVVQNWSKGRGAPGGTNGLR